MEKETKLINNELSQLADDARALLSATADVAGEKVSEARKRLSSALERGQEMCSRAQDKALESARIADNAVREYPYQAIAIGVGVGVLFGFLVANRCSASKA